MHTTPLERGIVILSSRADSQGNEKGSALVTAAISRWLPWTVKTLGKPENTALMAQSRSIPCPWTMRLNMPELLPYSTNTTLISGSHPAKLRHIETVKENVRSELRW